MESKMPEFETRSYKLGFLGLSRHQKKETNSFWNITVCNTQDIG